MIYSGFGSESHTFTVAWFTMNIVLTWLISAVQIVSSLNEEYTQIIFKNQEICKSIAVIHLASAVISIRALCKPSKFSVLCC